MAEYRFSRYPLIGEDPEKPLGYVHIKDLFLAERAGKDSGRPADFPSALPSVQGAGPAGAAAF